MRFRLILILALLCFGGCQNASHLLIPGGFDANKTTSGGGKSGGDTGDKSGIDKIVSTDVPPSSGSTPPPGSPPPVSAPPQGAGVNPLPAGDGSAQGGDPVHQYMLASGGLAGPMEPKTDGDAVGSGKPLGAASCDGQHYCLRYGPKFEHIAEASSNPEAFPLSQGGLFSLNLLLEEIVAGGKDAQGETQYSWMAEPDGPQVRIVYFPAGKKSNWEAAKFCDVKVSHSSDDGSNISFSDLNAGSGTAIFYLFKRQAPPPQLPEWMLAGLPSSQPSYETTGDFHPCDLVPFADQHEYYESGIFFDYVGELSLSRPPTLNGAIRSAPQSAP